MKRFYLSLFCLIPLLSYSQTREKGEWWPSEWGIDDQVGASNRITPEKVLEAMSLVISGNIYELGQIYEAEMPLYGTRSYSMVLPAKGPSGFGKNLIVGNEEFISTQIGQVGTQFDGLGHIGREVVMENGESQLVFYNGFTSKEMDASGGLRKLGIEHVKPIITRGILVDVASYKNVERLPNSYEVTLADVLGALENQGVEASSINPGDAILFRYGWSSLWEKPDEFNNNPPGIGLEVARWVAEKKVTLVGSDSFVTEVIPNPDPALIFPVHQELMMVNGIYNLENMQFDELIEDKVSEFLLIVTTIPFKGATGSPVRPIAIK